MTGEKGHVRIQKGVKGPDPSWKITSHMGFYRNKHSDTPGKSRIPSLLETVGPPLDPQYSFLCNKTNGPPL